MTELVLPSYEELDEALQQTTLKLHPSQVHGIVTGILCINDRSDMAWEQLVTGNEDSSVTHNVLEQLYKASKLQLEDFLFDFELELPSEDESLSSRAEALTLWCQGFLTGLKLVQVDIKDPKPAELAESINDLIEIAQMNYEEVVSNEEDEEAYFELVEYVRMAAIFVYQELKNGKEDAAPTDNKKLH